MAVTRCNENTVFLQKGLLVGFSEEGEYIIWMYIQAFFLLLLPSAKEEGSGKPKYNPSPQKNIPNIPLHFL